MCFILDVYHVYVLFIFFKMVRHQELGINHYAHVCVSQVIGWGLGKHKSIFDFYFLEMERVILIFG